MIMFIVIIYVLMLLILAMHDPTEEKIREAGVTNIWFTGETYLIGVSWTKRQFIALKLQTALDKAIIERRKCTP